MMCDRRSYRLDTLTNDADRKLRNSLGRFATGVTVVTCAGEAGLYGITVNSFSSVSLQPPRILWNIAKVSRSVDAFLAADFFAVNILAADQEALSVHFAQTDRPRFDKVDYQLSARGVPLLAATLACFECRTCQVYECGDHHIIVGEIEDFRYVDGDPLLFYAGQYAQIAR